MLVLWKFQPTSGFGFQGCWEQDINTTHKSWAKQRTYCTAKTLSCKRWTAIWFASAPKMTTQTRKPYKLNLAWMVVSLLLTSLKLDVSLIYLWILLISRVLTHFRNEMKCSADSHRKDTNAVSLSLRPKFKCNHVSIEQENLWVLHQFIRSSKPNTSDKR